MFHEHPIIWLAYDRARSPSRAPSHGQGSWRSSPAQTLFFSNKPIRDFHPCPLQQHFGNLGLVPTRRHSHFGLCIVVNANIAVACLRQVTITCGPVCARKSALVGMPQHLVAGVPRALTVYARDASGCPTEGRDTVSITVDSVSEGVRALSIKVQNSPVPAASRHWPLAPICNFPCHLKGNGGQYLHYI